MWTTNTVAFLIGVGMYSSFILIPEFVQEPASTGYGFGASVTAAGLFLLPSTIAMLLVGPDRRACSSAASARAASLIGGTLFALAAYVLLVAVAPPSVDIYVAAACSASGSALRSPRWRT